MIGSKPSIISDNLIRQCFFFSGFGDTENRFVPSIVKSLDPKKKWLDISGGQHHSLALDGEGKFLISLFLTSRNLINIQMLIFLE